MTTYHYRVALITWAVNDHYYINEFVDHHLNELKFDHVFIYHDSCEESYIPYLINYGEDRITCIPLNNDDDFLQEFSSQYLHNYTHCMFLNVDDFLILKTTSSVHEFINRFINDDNETCVGIAINGKIFGSRTHHYDTKQYDVKSRFLWCDNDGYVFVKTLFRTDYFLSFGLGGYNVQVLEYPYRSIQTTEGHIVSTSRNDQIDLLHAQINIYKTKTYDEFQEKYFCNGKQKTDKECIIMKSIFEYYDRNYCFDDRFASEKRFKAMK